MALEQTSMRARSVAGVFVSVAISWGGIAHAQQDTNSNRCGWVGPVYRCEPRIETPAFPIPSTPCDANSDPACASNAGAEPSLARSPKIERTERGIVVFRGGK